MSNDRDKSSWQALRASIGRWLLVALVWLWVFVGAAFALCHLDRWAYPDLRNRSGDVFVCLCAAAVVAIFSGRIVARWMRRPTNH
jgi:hypothetical protein